VPLYLIYGLLDTEVLSTVVNPSNAEFEHSLIEQAKKLALLFQLFNVARTL